MPSQPINSNPANWRDNWALPLYVATIFTSAALLFSVQPMFAKMVLPQLGGSPGVWSVAMVVFQSLLLAGYAYAHALIRWLPGTPGLALHLIVTIIASFTLPFAIRMTGTPPADGEMLYVIGIFLTAIGPSFFALSANGPLLQAWFVHTGHRTSHDPYFLYAASNIGSFLALFAYPFILEPLLTLGQQRLTWTWGYWFLLALIALCALLVAPRWPKALPAAANSNEPAEAISPLRILGWIALSAVPSGLLVAVTAQISTDIASAPMLWVIPLALYLFTFVIVFQPKPWIPHSWMLALQPVLVGAVILLQAFEIVDNISIVLVITLAAFFVCAMVCHGELVTRRPSARHLTGFYLAMSFGGMIGGMFAGLIAPKLFSWIAEYPALMVAALLCRPGLTLKSDLLSKPALFAAAVGAAVLAASALLIDKLGEERWTQVQLALVFAALAAGIVFFRQRAALAVTAAACFAIIQYFPSDGRARENVRSFFGVHKISETSDGRFRLLAHGTTTHGAQAITDENGKPLTGKPEPLTYYYEQSPIAQALRAARTVTGGPTRAGIIGLGTGSVACHTRPGDDWTYFEIDPDVVRIARNPKWFSFMSECHKDARVVLGDARLTLDKEPDASYDVLLIDAFSSDAIPVHLMTREAVALYKRKLKPRGILIMHISNRHMELASEVAALAYANNMVMALNDDDDSPDDEEYKYDSTVAALANHADDLKTLLDSGDWEPRAPLPNHRVWTDDYSNILGAIIRHFRKADDEDTPQPPKK